MSSNNSNGMPPGGAAAAAEAPTAAGRQGNKRLSSICVPVMLMRKNTQVGVLPDGGDMGGAGEQDQSGDDAKRVARSNMHEGNK